MQRDPRAFLWDVRESALAIQSFVACMDMAAYASNAMAQAAVERKFEIIGEALNQLSKFDAAAVGNRLASGDEVSCAAYRVRQQDGPHGRKL